MYIHSMGIIHRDVKSENVLILKNRNSYKIKIIDFGSVLLDDNTENACDVVGTPSYYSPEIIEG